jgi:nucleoid-associated protein YgaU
MGSVQQAVLEFDEEIQAPWRPRLVPPPVSDGAGSARPPLSHPSRRSPSRVGVCRPPSPEARPGRHEAHRPGRAIDAPLTAASPRPRPSSRPAPSRRPMPEGRSTAGRRPDPRASAPARLRLTRRARRLVVVVSLATCVAAGSWLGQLIGDGGDLRLAGQSSVVVQSGDSLWSIASSMDGDGDVRALVDEIQELNGLRDAAIRPGQTLLLP